jgi:GT2 family glycosyltransferase
MEVSIIIVNWNSVELLRGCIASIIRETRNLEFEIIVADAGSFDGCEPMLASEFPHVRFVQLEHNVGFAKANNIAYAEAAADCILFLNPDIELVGPAINHLQAAMQQLSNVGAVGARLLNEDGTLQTSCIQAQPTILNQLLSCEYLRQKWPNSKLWGMAALHTSLRTPQEVEAISGACVMTTRSAFERVGHFCEDYFMYAEDIDLSHRYRMAGYRNYYVPVATLIHYGGSSSDYAPSSFSAVMARESTWRFLRKSRGRMYAAAYRVSVFVAAVGRVTIGLLSSFFRPSSRAKHMIVLDKWLAILRWTLGCDCSLRRYGSV